MTLNRPEERLIVALDYPCWAEAEKLVQLLPEVKFFKVGLELYLASGGQAVSNLKKLGKEVFLDLKFHDIPNTVGRACRQAVEQGAAIFNLHASGGREMMRRGVQTARERAEELGIPVPLVIAVTVLTSLDEQSLQEIGLENVEETVLNFARLAEGVGMDGVVASPKEVALIRKNCGPDFKIICPGIRPKWAATNDQKRITTPREAISLGADYLVVGRPITAADDPRQAALRVMEEIKEALQ
ncbi:MAG: orotidine-5'-phosphate decarboxylase [Peptococcia bacterium]|jgi:orotidine-5'-phosphate decarboxylase